ncbi:hypothetical protein L6164_019677 [Bauhinia variegata]|uniref:Uncharacterized protein n=1 Tax=Bauhinia variegata TaxID=167791 RepID=A0ACB9MXB7_BAUVA|nr:hypothetical protein L6164_019677 [Bauhinia variegata]
MELHSKDLLGLVCVILLLPAALCTTSQGYFTSSRATYYGAPYDYGTSSGACGYGDYGRKVNDGKVTAVSSKLWRNGAGCGACYQVKCKMAQYCDVDGVIVMATDNGEGDRTDFIMSGRGFSELGRDQDTSAKLFKYGTVDVQYKRVPCKYASNIIVKIKEQSSNPYYLAIVLLNVGGDKDVTAIDLWQKDSKAWMPMRRVYGAVFDFSNPPSGQIKLRFNVNGNMELAKSPIPSNWKPGASYDTKIQFY